MRRETADWQNRFYKRRVLITGGLGFIGSNLARRLVELDAEVLLVDSLIPEYGGNLFNIAGIEDKIKVKIADVRDKKAIEQLVQEQDYLFNLAGQTSHLDSMEDPFTDLEINAKAQLSILEACRRYNPEIKIIFASTRQVYGKPDYLPVNESHPIQPPDINGVHKWAGEAYHQIYSHVYGMHSVILRLTNSIGPRMRIKDARQTFLGIWIRLIIEDKPFEVWGGSQMRDFTYVEDAVDAFLMAAVNDKAKEGMVFNLGGERVISLKDLARLLVEINGSGKYIVKEYPAQRKHIDIGDYYADFTLIKSVLGWEPKVSLEEALRKTLEYYKKHLNRYL